MKKRLSLLSVLFLFVLLAVAGYRGISVKANSEDGGFWNYYYNFISIDDREVSTESNGEKATVLIFGRTTCANTRYTVNNLGKSIWAKSEELRIIYADIDDASKEDVQAFASLYGSKYMDFCYSAEEDTINSISWQYLNAAGITGSITLPVVVLIDENDRVQKVMTNRQTVYDIIAEIENFTTLTYPEEPTDEPEDPSYTEPSVTDKPTGEINYTKYTSETAGGAKTSNIYGNNYLFNKWGQPVKSYLSEISSGYLRVEADYDKVYVEEYSYDYELLNVTELDMELPLFGGYYSGADYNFLVFGQENLNEDDSVEVMRIVKYDKAWNRISSQSVYGANTIKPFEAGSLRMTETQGMLYIHTCHQMYMSADGLNHQANMTYIIDELSMDILKSRYEVGGLAYVSHSFNQFVLTDGMYLYYLDHGDAYPRALAITKAYVNNTADNLQRGIFSISGEIGDNDTGVSIGGFELAGDKLITAGNSINQADATKYEVLFGVRNIFVAVTDTDLASTKINQLTYYNEDSEVAVGNPHLVKAGDDKLYVLWEESDEDRFTEVRKFTVVKIAEINSQGDTVGKIHTIYAGLSDCAPVYTSRNEIVWYVTRGTSPTFYHLPLDALDECEFTGRIDIKDCTVTLTPETFEYTDYHEYMPAVQLTYGSYILSENKDYTVEYANNYSPGTANVIINGKGIFTGTATYSFEITDAGSDNSGGGQGSDNPSDSNTQAGNSASGGSNGSSGGGFSWNDLIIKRTGNYSSSGGSSAAKSSVKKPGRVTGVTAYRSGKKIIVIWNSKNGAKGYQIQYSANKKFTKKKSRNVSRTMVSLKVKKSKACYIRVRAYKKASGRKIYGKWSKIKKIKM